MQKLKWRMAGQMSRSELCATVDYTHTHTHTHTVTHTHTRDKDAAQDLRITSTFLNRDIPRLRGSKEETPAWVLPMGGGVIESFVHCSLLFSVCRVFDSHCETFSSEHVDFKCWFFQESASNKIFSLKQCATHWTESGYSI